MYTYNAGQSFKLPVFKIQSGPDSFSYLKSETLQDFRGWQVHLKPYFLSLSGFTSKAPSAAFLISTYFATEFLA
jgi:hypothetical protein